MSLDHRGLGQKGQAVGLRNQGGFKSLLWHYLFLLPSPPCTKANALELEIFYYKYKMNSKLRCPLKWTLILYFFHVSLLNMGICLDSSFSVPELRGILIGPRFKTKLFCALCITSSSISALRRRTEVSLPPGDFMDMEQQTKLWRQVQALPTSSGLGAVNIYLCYKTDRNGCCRAETFKLEIWCW